MQVKFLHEDAKLPKRGSESAAGYDLFCIYDFQLPSKHIQKICTGVAIAIPSGFYGRIAPRSSLGSKGVIIHGGVVDADYRGEIIVILQNNSNQTMHFSKGDKIAQLILECITTPELEVVEDLDDTDRGVSGFGSTGR